MGFGQEIPLAEKVGTVGCVWNFQIGGGSIKAIFQSRKLKFDMALYFGLINSSTVAKKMSFKPNLHKTDWRYSVENYFIGFVRKFYPTLIYKQIKFRCFLQILQYCNIEVY